MTKAEKSRIQKEIIDCLPDKPHGRLLIAPRVGKTKVAIDIIRRENPLSILWVTPSAELADKEIPAEFETWKAKKFVKRLTTVTWMSLNKIKGEFDLIILDEEQFLTDNNSSGLRDGSLKYGHIISMTGTATKHVEKRELYAALNLETIYKMDINEAVDMGILSNYKVKVLQILLNDKDKTIAAGNKAKPFMTTEKAQYEYIDRMAKQAMYQKRADSKFQIINRMRAIKNSPSKHNAVQWLMDNLEGRKLFFCSSIKQADEVSDHQYHSKTDNQDLKKFMSGEINEICMVNAGGTGFTYKAIDNLVLAQSDSDKNGLTSQKICRTLLEQKDYEATIWLLCLVGTQDEKWVESALENFDKSKIEYILFKNLENARN